MQNRNVIINGLAPSGSGKKNGSCFRVRELCKRFEASLSAHARRFPFRRSWTMIYDRFFCGGFVCVCVSLYVVVSLARYYSNIPPPGCLQLMRL